jgi:hypothetical protein
MRLLLLALLATAATYSVAQGARVPDLSGTWNHPGIPGFEPLATGPTSLVNLKRRECGVANKEFVSVGLPNKICPPWHRAFPERKDQLMPERQGNQPFWPLLP